MVRDKLVTAWHISLEEFYRWLRNSRLLILGVMLVFIHVQIIEPLKGCAQLMGKSFLMLSHLRHCVILGQSVWLYRFCFWQ